MDSRERKAVKLTWNSRKSFFAILNAKSRASPIYLVGIAFAVIGSR